MSPPTARQPTGSNVRSLITAIASALGYGLWATLCNWPHGRWRALRAGLTQACLSFTATLSMVLLLEWLFRRGRTPLQGFLAASLGTTLIGAAVMCGVHALTGTPNILATIAPSLSIGTIFFVSYSWGLLVSARRAIAPQRDHRVA